MSNMIFMKIISFALFCGCLFPLAAQKADSSGIVLSAYLETYYNSDFNTPANHEQPVFWYNHNRHNEFNINLAYLKATYSTDIVRANLSLMTGTYANANLAAEPGVLRNVFEANIGVRLSPKIWLDAGILPSHIGFESAVSKDCPTLTRSMAAENSPYYESGVKLTYTPNDQWTLTALCLNGWQRINRPDGYSTPAFGTQIVYKPNAETTLNYSTFWGSDKPDSLQQMRIFHDLYGTVQLSDHFDVTAGFDLGMERKRKGGSDMNVWYSPVLIGKYTINSKYALAARVEYYSDKNGVIIATGASTAGFSCNFDFSPRSNMLMRMEARFLRDPNDIFIEDEGFSNKNFFLTASMAVSF